MAKQNAAHAKKTVVRFNHWYHPDMLARYAREPDIELLTVDQADEAAGWAALGRAQVYQISAAKDEVAPRWFADPALLERAPNVLCVSSSGAGFDTVDVAACTTAGVLVVNQAGGNAVAVAEHTLALMLDVAKRVSETDRKLRTSRGYTREDVMGRQISGRTLGVVGIGHVGTRVTSLARAFGMTVLATDPHVSDADVAARGARKVELDELLATADFVSLHCPRDQTSLGMIGPAQFAAMKPGAVFITTARGGIHDEAALLGALQSGHLAGAGIDVWDIEPPPLDHPLLGRDDVVATYHTAGVTHEARANMARIASEQVIGVLAGHRPPRLINPEAWPRFVERFEATFGFAPR